MYVKDVIAPNVQTQWAKQIIFCFGHVLIKDVFFFLILIEGRFFFIKKEDKLVVNLKKSKTKDISRN